MESTCLLGALAFLIARAVVGHEDGIWLETPEGSLETTEGQNITLKYRYEIDYPDGKRKFTIAIKKADSHERISFEAYIDLATGRMSNISNTLKGKLHVTSTLGCLTIVLANVTSQDSGSYFVDIIIEPILTKAALSHEIAITVHGPVSPPKVEPECSQDGSGILHIELDVPNLIESNVAENYTMHLPFPRCPTDGSTKEERSSATIATSLTPTTPKASEGTMKPEHPVDSGQAVDNAAIYATLAVVSLILLIVIAIIIFKKWNCILKLLERCKSRPSVHQSTEQRQETQQDAEVQLSLLYKCTRDEQQPAANDDRPTSGLFTAL